MSDSPRPSFLGAGVPVRSGRPERPGQPERPGLPHSSAVLDDGELHEKVAGRPRWSTPALVAGLGVVLVALLVTAWWALSRDVPPAIAPGPAPSAVIEPDRTAGSQPADPAPAPELPAESAPEGAEPEDAVVEPASIDEPRPDSSITGHTVSAELCEALTVVVETSNAAMSADGQSTLFTPELLAAYVALGEVSSPYQSTYRDFAALLSDGSIPISAETDALSDAFTDAARVDQVTCL